MIRIRPMTDADVSLGIHLSRQAGWNQTETDWRRALELDPAGCFVAECQGQPVGTATACAFGDVAWVALVLVDVAARNRGAGTALMEHTLTYLDGRGVNSVRLTATPMGQPIYEKLGFVGEYHLARYEGMLPPAPPVAGVESVPPERLAELARLEQTYTGLERDRLLVCTYREWPEAMRMVQQDGRVVGFLSARRGFRAVYVGPCRATPEAGPILLADAWHRLAGQPVFMDLPLANTRALALAEAQGLKVQRQLLWMWRGPKGNPGTDDLWASWGPEKG
jgi:GNAT superfamily N-acetyltransferase